MSVKYAVVSEHGKAPTRKFPKDAGIDLYTEDVEYVQPHSSKVVKTGVSVALPKGHVGLLKPKGRSDFLIGAGVIDENYQGELLVKVINYSNTELVLQKGDAVAQMLIVPVTVEPLEEVPSKEELFGEKTDRASTGGIVTQFQSSFSFIDEDEV